MNFGSGACISHCVVVFPGLVRFEGNEDFFCAVRPDRSLFFNIFKLLLGRSSLKSGLGHLIGREYTLLLNQNYGDASTLTGKNKASVQHLHANSLSSNHPGEFQNRG